MPKVLYDKRGEIAYITLNRPDKRNAMELELMGEPVTAQRAKEIHLVNRVVPRDQLMPTA